MAARKETKDDMMLATGAVGVLRPGSTPTATGSARVPFPGRPLDTTVCPGLVTRTVNNIVTLLRDRAAQHRRAFMHAPLDVADMSSTASSSVHSRASSGSPGSSAYDSDTAPTRRQRFSLPWVLYSEAGGAPSRPPASDALDTAAADTSAAKEAAPQAEDMSGQADELEVMRETAAALRQVGAAAHDALATVQHVFQDTPDAAAEMAGNMMGRGNYHHPKPHSAPVSPRRVRSATQEHSWAGRLLPHASSDDTAAADVGGMRGLAGQSDPGAAPTAAPANGEGEAEQRHPPGFHIPRAHLPQMPEGLRTASHTIRHPHAAAAEAAGRMLGKSNYGHR